MSYPDLKNKNLRRKQKEIRQNVPMARFAGYFTKKVVSNAERAISDAEKVISDVKKAVFRVTVQMERQMQMKLKMKMGVAVLVMAFLTMAFLAPFPSMADEWDRSEDGKYWMYFDNFGEAVTDEWIEYQGKTYYVDAKGYMKTGWVKNKDDGNKYYMGEDGAMYVSAFTPDGHYVGPDGVTLEGFDQYRKELKSELKKASKKKGAKKSKSGGKSQSFFVLADLNLDGYKDLVVMNVPEEAAFSLVETVLASGGVLDGSTLSQAGGKLTEVAMWEPEDGKFQLAAEFDLEDEGQTGALYLDAQGEKGAWLEIADRNGELRLFQMEYNTISFENVWSFTIELDEWGGAQYYLNGDEEERAVWEAAMVQARQVRGNLSLAGFLLVTDENITSQVDKEPSEEEVRTLW